MYLRVTEKPHLAVAWHLGNLGSLLTLNIKKRLQYTQPQPGVSSTHPGSFYVRKVFVWCAFLCCVSMNLEILRYWELIQRNNMKNSDCKHSNPWMKIVQIKPSDRKVKITNPASIPILVFVPLFKVTLTYFYKFVRPCWAVLALSMSN